MILFLLDSWRFFSVNCRLLPVCSRTVKLACQFKESFVDFVIFSWSDLGRMNFEHWVFTNKNHALDDGL